MGRGNTLPGNKTVIRNNNITDNYYAGVLIDSNVPVTIENNTITRNFMGILINSYTDKIVLANNNVYDKL